MKIAFFLRRKPESAPASALLLLSHDMADLARLCVSHRFDPLPPIYPVADGFLLKLSSPSTAVYGGALRLRSLADNLFLPVDADLLPTLLADEIADLVRRRGLVLLPGGRVLEFDPDRPLPLSELLAVNGLRRERWLPLPEPPALADRLTQIVVEMPEVGPDEMLAEGGEEIGTEDPRPDAAGFPSWVMGKTALGAGKALASLGKLLGLKGLAKTGMKWMNAGVNMAPRLAESLMSKQEASLRALLRAFREGKIEQALRRALPLDGGERGAAAAATGARLPFNNLLYSLRNILGEGAGGKGGLWPTDYELFRELNLEYRRQAELATQRGDYRRAAFIYGKLLRDYASAAAVLSRGGLHRDAATLYLKRLDNPLAAAREYEAAGEIDRALALYRKQKEHLLAAELLRRAGEEDAALEEFSRAAGEAVAKGRGHYEAGEIMRSRAGRMDLALPYFEMGWTERPSGSPVPCALRLAQVYAQGKAAQKLRGLADGADDYFQASGNDALAANFYNELAGLANRFPEIKTREDFRDRALTGIACKLRQRVIAAENPSTLASTMLGESQVWPPAVVSDAQFALQKAVKLRRPAAQAPTLAQRVRFRARLPVVTAVCQAAQSGDIFLGFESGEVICFRPATGEVCEAADEGMPILSLAATDLGDALVVLTSMASGDCTLRSLVRRVRFEIVASQHFGPVLETVELSRNLYGTADNFVAAIWYETSLTRWQGPGLIRVGSFDATIDIADGPRVSLLWASPMSGAMGMLAFQRNVSTYIEDPITYSASFMQIGGIGWNPVASASGGLVQPTISWLDKGPQGLELAGVDTDGVLYMATLRWDDGKYTDTVTKAVSNTPPFLAAAVMTPNLIAGVTHNAVHWLRNADTPVTFWQSSVVLPSPVACFRHHRGQELIVVCADGTLVRVRSGH